MAERSKIPGLDRGKTDSAGSNSEPLEGGPKRRSGWRETIYSNRERHSCKHARRVVETWGEGRPGLLSAQVGQNSERGSHRKKRGIVSPCLGKKGLKKKTPVFSPLRGRKEG